MPLSRHAPNGDDLDHAIGAAERRIGELLVLSGAQAATGRFERARQTRLLAVLRQDELNRLRALQPSRRI
jgi:hypothetical protein